MGRILVFTTGGTIASTYDPIAGGLISNIGGDDLIKSVPGLSSIAEVSVIELANMSSTFLTPKQVFEWTREVHRRLSEQGVLGAVVTHGTDTLEESAYLFDLALHEEKPIVFTGAMRAPTELINDGPRNLLASARTAADPAASGLGVLVVLNDEIHAAREVTKTHSEALEAFKSPGLGPLAVISRGRGRDDLLFYRRPCIQEHIATERIEERVSYVKTVLGSDSSMIDASVNAGTAGIVIEAFGGGEVTPFMADGIESARARGVEIVVATRAACGRPLDLYADVGEGQWLRERGVHFAGNIGGPKARVKLMLALGLGPGADIARYF